MFRHLNIVNDNFITPIWRAIHTGFCHWGGSIGVVSVLLSVSGWVIDQEVETNSHVVQLKQYSLLELRHVWIA